MQLRCIGIREVLTIIPVARATIYRWMNPTEDDPFLQAVKIGPCRVCWWLHEVLEWLERRRR